MCTSNPWDEPQPPFSPTLDILVMEKDALSEITCMFPLVYDHLYQ